MWVLVSRLSPGQNGAGGGEITAQPSGNTGERREIPGNAEKCPETQRNAREMMDKHPEMPDMLYFFAKNKKILYTCSTKHKSNYGRTEYP